MELKGYQERVLREVGRFFQVLAEQQKAGNHKYASQEAWEVVRNTLYRWIRNGAGKDMPNFCIKVPTGGGKTLLATQILGLAYKTILAARNGTGLVLWVVPTDQIYRDTLKALRDRHHFYRESLEFSLSRRIEVWEKHEIARLTPTQLAGSLNILLIKLQGTNRQDRETLKFFRDSGGNIVQHFPPEDDYAAHKALKGRVPNLDMVIADDDTGEYLCKTSVANLVRLCEPVVILDEKQKATSDLARQTINSFNPSLVIELSATPPEGTNILSSVTGEELLKEEMIKLPINVNTSASRSWAQCLTQARDKREELAAQARKYSSDTGKRLIRPIVLVQVERVGVDQRGGNHVHSEDVREYLVQRLGADSQTVKIKTSESNEIEDINLLADDCQVEWIITKSALQEGWDCPFAYILVSLANVRSLTSMTQLVGRVLRQPFVEKTDYPNLNESYVYCLHDSSTEVVYQIRGALMKEGYQGDFHSIVDRSDGKPGTSVRSIGIRSDIPPNYLAPIPGRILLPRFCLQTDASAYEPLDYYRHLLRHVDIRHFAYSEIADWDFSSEILHARELFFRVYLDDEALEHLHLRDTEFAYVESDEQAKAWLVSNLNLSWYSARSLKRIVEEVCERLPSVKDKLALIRFSLLEKIRGFIDKGTDQQTEAVFLSRHRDGLIKFYLDSKDCTFEVPKSIERRMDQSLRRRDGTSIQRSLFESVPEEGMNDYEKEFAEVIDTDGDVYWWYRNAVGEFRIQGYHRHPIYPDYIIQMGHNNAAAPQYFLVETKGAHLSGNQDTTYKRDIAKYFSEIGNRVKWQQLSCGDDRCDFHVRVLDEGEYPGNAWKDEWHKMKAEFHQKLQVGFGYEPYVSNRVIIK